MATREAFRLVRQQDRSLHLWQKRIRTSHVMDLSGGKDDLQGLPRASTNRRILVLRPPLLLPIAWSPSVLTAPAPC